MKPSTPASVASINFAWLLRLRWGALAGQALLIVGVALWLQVEVAWRPVATIWALELLSNGLAVWASGRFKGLSRPGLPVLMVLDVALFTSLLFFTGGASNPFSFLYLVYIALAAVILTPSWSWTLAGLAQLAFGALFVLGPRSEHMQMMQMHLQGMWVAFGVAAAFIVYFVQRVTRALAKREAELAESRARSERQARIASLATLAAGAAHELSTPLSTIAVVAGELEREVSAEALDDVRLIREQVERCRAILAQMAADVGASPGEVEQSMPIAHWVAVAVKGLSQAERVQLDPGLDGAVVGPPRALTHALRGVLKNALQATGGTGQVRVALRGAGDLTRLEVTDFGAGMEAEVLARAGEPFFTTKAPGEGIGLGLFISRSVLEQLGGRLELTSKPGQGTVAAMVLPLVTLQQGGRLARSS